MEMEEMTSARRGGGGGGGGGGGELIHYQQQDEDEEEGSEELHSKTIESNRLRAWHSSRIFRVSRASGGKDRHSKVLTAKGLRDRRVRLSVSTAIQFYDLQDRLGVDQPSKAVEWLIKKAADDISKLPSLESKFPNNYLSDDDKRIVGSGRGGFEVELDNESIFQKQPLAISMSKSACSSTSETSKGSRSENRAKARERARERAAKDKDKEQLADESHHNSQNSSFTELLTSGGGNHSPNQSTPGGFFLKQPRHHSPSPPTSMDYFSSGLFGPSAPAPARNQNQFSSAFSPHFGVTMPPPFNDQTRQNHHHHHPELQQFSFLSDHLIPGEQTGNEYNLNFSMSSSLAGYNRGTLQSNSSPSPLPQPQPPPPPHLQRFAFPADASNMLFCVGNPTNNATAPENHQFPLQLYYGGQHSETKGKDKR